MSMKELRERPVCSARCLRKSHLDSFIFRKLQKTDVDSEEEARHRDARRYASKLRPGRDAGDVTSFLQTLCIIISVYLK